MHFWGKVLVSVKRTLKTLENIFPSLGEMVTLAPTSWVGVDLSVSSPGLMRLKNAPEETHSLFVAVSVI